MEEKKFVGPQRTWKCESGKHEVVIQPGSIFAIAWATQQEQEKAGPLIIPDVSCHLCHPRLGNLESTNNKIV